MSRYAIKFPFRVRIHGGEFDESARAIHREDGLKTIQAESGIVLGSTIERKQMSTKTTFKRIALVTVAALSFGVIATAPSNAAAAGGALGVTQTLSESTTTVAAGTAAKVTLTTAGYFTAADSVTSSVAFANFSGVTDAKGVTEALNYASSAGGSYLKFSAIDTGTATTNADLTVSAGGSNQTAASQGVEVGLAGNTPKFISTKTQLSVTLNYPGTYVYTIQNLNKLGTTDTYTDGTATKLTWTVVVTTPTLGGTTAIITATTSSTAGSAPASTAVDGLPATLTASATLAAAAVARIDIRQWATSAKLASLADAYSKSVIVAVSGAGSLSASGVADTSRGSTVITAAATAAYNDYFLHADGRTGKSTITITVDGTLIATKEFLFFGALASYSVEADAGNIGKGEVVDHTVTGLDASKNIATLGTIYAESSDKTIATVAVVGGVVSVTGVAVGTATITIGNKAVLADSTIKTTVTAKVLPVTAPTIAWAFDKDSYEPGEKMTLTVTAAGIADGARAVFGSTPTTNFTPSGVQPTWATNPAFVSGVKTFTIYAPATSGKFTVSATIGQAIDTEVALKKASDAADAAAVPTITTPSYLATKVSISATVSNPALAAAQEATDAANEATDAGNNAKDAADQAIEAADAATIAAQDAQAAADAAKDAAEQAGQDAVDAAAEATDAANNAADIAAQAIESADAATAAAEEASAAATAAGEMAVEAAEAAGAIAQDALDAANAATDAALSAAEAADAATAAATEAKESADAATAAVAALSTEVAKLMAALNAKITTLSNLVAKIAKKVKA